MNNSRKGAVIFQFVSFEGLLTENEVNTLDLVVLKRKKDYLSQTPYESIASDTGGPQPRVQADLALNIRELHVE